MDVPHIACQMAVKLANGELVTREVALVMVRLLQEWPEPKPFSSIADPCALAGVHVRLGKWAWKLASSGK